MDKAQFDDSGAGRTQTDTNAGECSTSRALPSDAVYDLPLCPNHIIAAVETVRGSGSALSLLREHLNLRASARIVFSSYANCYFLQVDAFDRFQNAKVGKLEAVSCMPFRSGDILKNEISSWRQSEITRVVGADGLKALQELRLI